MYYIGIDNGLTGGISVIKDNKLISNRIGIYFSLGAQPEPCSPSVDNKIYHNKFIDSVLYQSFCDEGCSNIWDNGSSSGGNYWSDYSSSDNDGDGIGDMPYYIPGKKLH